MKTLGLLGTAFTIQECFYKGRLKERCRLQADLGERCHLGLLS